MRERAIPRYNEFSRFTLKAVVSNEVRRKVNTLFIEQRLMHPELAPEDL